MNRTSLDRNWEFVPGVAPGPNAPGEPPVSRTVHLPHDFTIETDTDPQAPGGASTGYYRGGVGSYTRYLEVPAQVGPDRTLVEFDGAAGITTVVLNGHKVACHHYGYTPFHADLTPHLVPGKANRLTVTVNNTAEPNSRWYMGSGLYRHVDLLTAPPLHISPWGVCARLAHCHGETAFVDVETTVENHSARLAELGVEVRIVEQETGVSRGSGRTKVVVDAEDRVGARARVKVDQARWWDLDDPFLYRIEVRLTEGETLLDEDHVAWGLRTVTVDPLKGFQLNGKTLKLKGGCLHHDNGLLGAAAYADAERRKVQLHKDQGFNALRCAHNPPSQDLLAACDRLGMLVFDEAFDMWTMEKTAHDHSLYFEQDWKADLDAMVLRDRNHPSVVLWSTGNEITERGGLSGGHLWAQRLAQRVRTLDPTRPVSNALCSLFAGLDDFESAHTKNELEHTRKDTGTVMNNDTSYGFQVWGPRTEAYCAPLDVVGYNYLAHRYEADGQDFPDRVICCTESMPLDMLEYWEAVERHPFLIGDFVWTSQDYIGEAGVGKVHYLDPGAQTAGLYRAASPYPWRLANCADLDLCGFERPQMAYRRIVWGSGETFIASRDPANEGKHEVLSRWGWPEVDHSWTWDGREGRLVGVEVYSRGDEAELWLNGTSLGRQATGRALGYRARFTVAYQPGLLRAVSYRGGVVISQDEVETAGAPARLRLGLDRPFLPADGQSLGFVTVEVVDAQGRRVPHARVTCQAAVEGGSTLVAFGSSDPRSQDNYTRGTATSFQGRLLAIVRASEGVGVAVLGISSPGLESGKVLISLVEPPNLTYE